MKKESCFFYAIISKTYKTDGTLLIKNNRGLQDINKEEPFFIEFNKILVPFFIEHFELKNNTLAYIKFETISSENQAQEYIGKEILTTKNNNQDKDDLPISKFIGFNVFDKNKNIGKIVDYNNIPGNPLIILENDNNEIFIPFNDDFVVKIDNKKKLLYLDIPDGLLGLYLDN